MKQIFAKFTPYVSAACLALAIDAIPSSRGAVSTSQVDSKQAALQAAVLKVYDTSILHRINITIPEADVATVGTKSTNRVKCIFTFDGLVLKDVGIRQAGGTAHPYVPISNKPSLSIKFDEFVKGQDLHGLEKMVLKNELQDMSLMNEHMTYEVFRRAGLAAPTTAHAVVTINGILNGIYLMREPVNKEFLIRNFGKGNETGNLYEFNYTFGDFVLNPKIPELKNEEAEKRTRSDIINLAATVSVVPPEFFIQGMTPLMDINRYITFFAAEAVTSNFDSFSFHHNNSYMYALPKDGRFVFIPHGADESFWATGTPITRLSSPLQAPASSIARKLQAVPELMKMFQDEVARIGSDKVWDQKALLARVAQVGRIFATAEKTGRTVRDLALFEDHRAMVEQFIKDSGTIHSVRP